MKSSHRFALLISLLLRRNSIAFAPPSHVTLTRKVQSRTLQHPSGLNTYNFQWEDTEEEGGSHPISTERARIEKKLDAMLGEDWRVFRAQLVAKELVEAEEFAQSQANEYSETFHDELHEIKANIGNIFEGAISSIFPNKDGAKDLSNNNEENIFNGDNVGRTDAYGAISDDCPDPFLTHDEVPIMLRPTNELINKDHWAHTIGHIEPGCVLIANEKLGGAFHQTVVLIIEHDEKEGTTTGIVINRPLKGNLFKVAQETTSNVDVSERLVFSSSPVSYGGPIWPEEYFILHSHGYIKDSKRIAPGIYVGGSRELMDEVRRNELDPNDALFVKGHSAWVEGQLQREISRGVWYIASCSEDFILRYVKPHDSSIMGQDLWKDLLTAMGGRFEEVARKHSGKGDARMMP